MSKKRKATRPRPAKSLVAPGWSRYMARVKSRKLPDYWLAFVPPQRVEDDAVEVAIIDPTLTMLGADVSSNVKDLLELVARYRAQHPTKDMVLMDEVIEDWCGCWDNYPVDPDDVLAELAKGLIMYVPVTPTVSAVVDPGWTEQYFGTPLYIRLDYPHIEDQSRALLLEHARNEWVPVVLDVFEASFTTTGEMK